MEVIKDLVRLYSEINIIYIELHKLDISGNKDCDKFNMLVSLLKRDIGLEKKLFNKLNVNENFDYDKLYSILRKSTDRPFDVRAEDYVTGNDFDILLYDELDKDIYGDIVNDIKYSKLYSACSKNMFLVYLSFLQEYAESNSFGYLRDRILNYKYYNSFINHDIEGILIETSFNVDRINYINLDFMVDILKLKDSDKVILDCCIDTIRTTISQLLSIDDNDYMDDNKMVVSINNQCMLRASLIILNERDYNNIKTSIMNEFDGLCTSYNKISASIIRTIFNDRTKDKSRVRKISLNPLGDCLES